MQVNRRELLKWASAASLASSGVVRAQSGTARLIVGFPPGGLADSVARVVAPQMAKGTGTPTIVENKPGAAGQLGVQAMRQGEPDGLTLLVTSASILTLTPHLYRKPMFDSLRDVTCISTLCDQSFALAVPATSPVKSVAEFIAWGKANPKELNFASPGLGTSPHFLGVMFGRETGLAMNHIAYKGTAPGLQDLIGGQVASTFNPLPTMIEFHQAGRIRILAVTNPRRVASLPDVPTFSELKLRGLEYLEWYGMFAPARTSDNIVRRLQEAVHQAVASKEFVDAAKRLELEPRTIDAAGLRKLLEADSNRWAGIVKATGITLDS
jgi:tripartite-type tricarboxylate transporter receptor subunit TctC